MTSTMNTRANAAAPPDPYAPHEVNLQKPAHWGNQLGQADTAMMQDDFSAMGMSPERVEELVNTPETIRVDGFAQPMPRSGDGEAAEGTGVPPPAQRRKITKSTKGLMIMKGRGGGNVKDWYLYDPQFELPDGLPSPPAIFKKFLLYEPGNKKVVLFNPGSNSLTLKKTPECLIDKAVKYTDKGPKIVDLTPEQAETLGIKKSIEDGEQFLMSGALPNSDDEASEDEASKRAKIPPLPHVPAYTGKGKGRADGRAAPPEMPAPAARPHRSQRGREDIPAIITEGSPEPRILTKERLAAESVPMQQSAVSSPPKKRSSRRQQHQEPEIANPSIESAQPSSPPTRKLRRQLEDIPEVPVVESETAAVESGRPAKKRRRQLEQVPEAPAVKSETPAVESAPPTKKQRTRRPPPPPRAQPVREGKGKRSASEIEEVAAPPAAKKRRLGEASASAPKRVEREPSTRESVPPEQTSPPPAAANTGKRKGGQATKSATKGLKRVDSAIKSGGLVKAKRTRKPSKPAITPALVVDSDE